MTEIWDTPFAALLTRFARWIGSRRDDSVDVPWGPTRVYMTKLDRAGRTIAAGEHLIR
jgi:hypothetical protein